MDEVKLEHEEWEVLVLARKIFGVQQRERPWLRHQQIEPTIKLHLVEPKVNGDEPPVCICGSEIPPLIMQKYYWMKAICEGKRAGERIVP